MALLAAYRGSEQNLCDFLDEKIFCGAEEMCALPEKDCAEGFGRYALAFKKLLDAEDLLSREML